MLGCTPCARHPTLPFYFHCHCSPPCSRRLVFLLSRRRMRHEEGRNCFPWWDQDVNPSPWQHQWLCSFPCICVIFFFFSIMSHFLFMILFFLKKTDLATSGGERDKNKALHIVPPSSVRSLQLWHWKMQRLLPLTSLDHIPQLTLLPENTGTSICQLPCS